jgi:hypothetical protein
LKNAADYPTNTAIALLLAGHTGTGKSSHLFYWPRVGVVDLESNLKGALDYHKSIGTDLSKAKYDQPFTSRDGKPLEERYQYDRVVELVNEAIADPEVSTVVVDGFGKLCDLLKAKLVWEQNAAEKPLIIGGLRMMTQSLWNPFAQMLKSFVWDIRAKNKPFIMTAHLKVDENELTTVKEERVDLQGQLQASFPKCFSDYFMSVSEPVAVTDKYPRGTRYKLRTAPTMRNPSLKTSFTGLPAEFEATDECFKQLLSKVAGGNGGQAK